MQFTYTKLDNGSKNSNRWAIMAGSRRIGIALVDDDGVTAISSSTPWPQVTATTLEEAAELLWQREATSRPGRKANWEDNGGVGKMKSGSILHAMPTWAKDARQRPA